MLSRERGGVTGVLRPRTAGQLACLRQSLERPRAAPCPAAGNQRGASARVRSAVVVLNVEDVEKTASADTGNERLTLPARQRVPSMRHRELTSSLRDGRTHNTKVDTMGTVRIRAAQAILSLSLSLSASEAAFGATQVYTVLTKGRTAIAQYVQYTDGYCKATSIDVFAMSNSTRYVSDTSYEAASLVVQVYEYNSCTGTDERFLSGYTESFKLSIPNTLDPATASGEVVVSDSNGSSKTVRVDLRWLGGTLSKDRSRFVWASEFERFIVKTADAVRTGGTISGSITVDGVDLLSPVNVVDYSSISGFLFSTKGGSIDIMRSR
jgi:hypothetical protein